MSAGLHTFVTALRIRDGGRHVDTCNHLNSLPDRTEIEIRYPSAGTVCCDVRKLKHRSTIETARAMPGRLPTASDFPSNLTLSIIAPPSSSPEPVNVLILLHGLGDSHAPFVAFARNLSLPETACISIQAPHGLPFELDGFHWGDDMLFDQSTGDMDVDAGFDRAKTMVGDKIIEKGLVQKCGYRRSELFLFGFGQGGMVALAVAGSLAQEEALGGVISVGGPLPSSMPSPGPQKLQTPVLILGGNSASLITNSALARIKNTFEYVDTIRWERRGDSMPRNREELLPIMRFLAGRLRSRRGVPKGSVEVT
ncbi:MAG: hypothetical protein M1816_003459 [Peltula sp. TS41687]|nr:MAG: hypothetical protein M1816_003459 [Peltula sp. TS41687]